MLNAAVLTGAAVLAAWGEPKTDVISIRGGQEMQVEFEGLVEERGTYRIRLRRGDGPTTGMPMQLVEEIRLANGMVISIRLPGEERGEEKEREEVKTSRDAAETPQLPPGDIIEEKDALLEPWLHLELGQCYRVFAQIPLCPRHVDDLPDSFDSIMSAVRRTRQVGSRDDPVVITILERRPEKRSGNLWYRVRSEGGVFWLNSKALVRKRIAIELPGEERAEEEAETTKTATATKAPTPAPEPAPRIVDRVVERVVEKRVPVPSEDLLARTMPLADAARWTRDTPDYWLGDFRVLKAKSSVVREGWEHELSVNARSKTDVNIGLHVVAVLFDDAGNIVTGGALRNLELGHTNGLPAREARTFKADVVCAPSELAKATRVLLHVIWAGTY